MPRVWHEAGRIGVPRWPAQAIPDEPVSPKLPGERAIDGPDGFEPSLRGCRILVVDDNEDGADSLAMMLELIGGTTSVAYDGETALELLETFKPNVVLLDLSLPGLKGDEVARLIRQRQPERQVLLVAVTGWGRREDRIRSLESGFDYHLVKPVEVQTLQALLWGDPRGCPEQT